MKMIDFDKATKGLEDIRKFHNSGKKLFLNDLKSADSIDDLKKIMVNHVKVFFDDMNFMFSLSGKSFELIRYVSKTNKKNV